MKTLLVGSALIVLTSLPMTAAVAESDSVDAPERRCLSITRIRNIDIVDDRTLYFHMRGGEYDYVNRMPHRCIGLHSRGTFMHSTSTNNYCDLDMITVIDTSLGMRLGSCPLGRFEAVERGTGPRTIRDRDEEGQDGEADTGDE